MEALKAKFDYRRHTKKEIFRLHHLLCCPLFGPQMIGEFDDAATPVIMNVSVWQVPIESPIMSKALVAAVVPNTGLANCRVVNSNRILQMSVEHGQIS